MHESVSLNREIIIKESDVSISYHSMYKKNHTFLSPFTATCSLTVDFSLRSYLTVVGRFDCIDLLI